MPQSITAESLAKILISYASPSLGMHGSHTLDKKIFAAFEAGFSGIEIGFPDLLAYAKSQTVFPVLHGVEWAPDEPDPFEQDEVAWTAIQDAAQKLRAILDEREMRVILLQPFSQYEGWRGDGVRREWVWRKAERWLAIAHILRSEALQVWYDIGCTLISDSYSGWLDGPEGR
jgi:sugar phosphate isomerase/epimerase